MMKYATGITKIMKPSSTAFTVLAIFFISMGVVACIPTETPQRELLIYCGITMSRPMTEIADIFEEKEDIKVFIIKGGSGNLLRSIEINGVGDLYLPGSDGYIKSAQEKGLIVDTNLVSQLVDFISQKFCLPGIMITRRPKRVFANWGCNNSLALTSAGTSNGSL